MPGLVPALKELTVSREDSRLLHEQLRSSETGTRIAASTGNLGAQGQASSSSWRRVSKEGASNGVLPGASGSRSSIWFTKSDRRTSPPVYSLTTPWALYQVPFVYNFKSFQQCHKVDVNFPFCKSGNRNSKKSGNCLRPHSQEVRKPGFKPRST